LRSAPGTSDFQSPRATARTASAMWVSGRLMRREAHNVITANETSETAATMISHLVSERPSISPTRTSSLRKTCSSLSGVSAHICQVSNTSVQRDQ
jgi:hypothetical protein